MRKSQALLKSAVVKPSASAKEHQAWLAKFVPAEGCEEVWAHYVSAVKESDEAYARYDALGKQVEKEGGSSSAKSWEAFQAAGHVSTIKTQAVFGYHDAYVRCVKAIGVPVVAAEDDLRAIVGASLNDNMDGLAINLKSIGLLGARVAQAIRGDVIEEESTDIPYCQEHA